VLLEEESYALRVKLVEMTGSAIHQDEDHA
jgi:hypothetical protein